ncbi:hypothetical protein DBV15_06695 [Temnothorax longispinosus]|uniref:Uncharacterized protein n=1 Tax=Temnothorax longispinosus TaxID=300112 RepID=A0A4S2L567_9HYME|nr:hypothetical protein DBV15_06695 [Temnothorax longispinosus]
MNCAELTWFSFRRGRGSRVRELRRHIDTPLETRRHWPLPLQRLRALLQDERTESTSHQAETTPGVPGHTSRNCAAIAVAETAASARPIKLLLANGARCVRREQENLLVRKNVQKNSQIV